MLIEDIKWSMSSVSSEKAISLFLPDDIDISSKVAPDQEALLASFPCLNFIDAIHLLKNQTLPDLMNESFPYDYKCQFPEKVSLFCKIINQDHSLKH
jgi:hypothetical protein